MTQLYTELDSCGLLGPIREGGRAVEQIKERASLLRKKTVREVEWQLLSAAKRLCVTVFFHRPSFMAWADSVFTFPSPLSVPGYGASLIEVLGGLMYWPAPLLMDAPYHFIHELSHLIAGKQPPTQEPEGWEQAAFELAVVRWLERRVPKERVRLSREQEVLREVWPISEEGWAAWRVSTGTASEAKTVGLARMRFSRQLNGPFFLRGGTPRPLRAFPVSPVVKKMNQVIATWRRNG